MAIPTIDTDIGSSGASSTALPDFSFNAGDFNLDTSLNLSPYRAPSTYQAPSDFEAPTSYRDTGGATTPVTTFDLAPSLSLSRTADLTPDLSFGVPDLLGAAASMAAPTVEAAPETTWSPGELAFLDETSAMLAEDLGKVGELTQPTLELTAPAEGSMSVTEMILAQAGVYTFNEQGQVVPTATFMGEAPQDVSGPLIENVVRARDAIGPSGLSVAEEVVRDIGYNNADPAFPGFSVLLGRAIGPVARTETGEVFEGVETGQRFDRRVIGSSGGVAPTMTTGRNFFDGQVITPEVFEGVETGQRWDKNKPAGAVRYEQFPEPIPVQVRGRTVYQTGRFTSGTGTPPEIRTGRNIFTTQAEVEIEVENLDRGVVQIDPATGRVGSTFFENEMFTPIDQVPVSGQALFADQTVQTGTTRLGESISLPEINPYTATAIEIEDARVSYNSSRTAAGLPEVPSSSFQQSLIQKQAPSVLTDARSFIENNRDSFTDLDTARDLLTEFTGAQRLDPTTQGQVRRLFEDTARDNTRANILGTLNLDPSRPVASQIVDASPGELSRYQLSYGEVFALSGGDTKTAQKIYSELNGAVTGAMSGKDVVGQLISANQTFLEGLDPKLLENPQYKASLANMNARIEEISKGTKDIDQINSIVVREYSNFANRWAGLSEGFTDRGFFQDTNRYTGESQWNVGNILTVVSAGLGAIQALYLGPKNQKDYLKWQEKQAEKNREWQKEMYQMQRGGGGGGRGRGTPSAAAAVSF